MPEPSKIIVSGPFTPITGVTLANKIVKKGLVKHKSFQVTVIDTSYPMFFETLGKFTIKKAFYYLRIQLQAFKVFKNDVIYFTPGQTFWGMVKYAPMIWLASLSRKQIIQHLNGNFLGRNFEQLTGVKRLLFKHLVKRSGKAIVLSESLKKNYTHFLPEEKIFTLANCVEDELFEYQERLDEKNYQELRIVYLSNLMPEKGIIDLLDALKILEDKNIPYTARLAGNIAVENKAIINDKVEALQHTSYLGVVDTLGKRELLLWSNVFVLPTYYTMEGQPFSILESMSLGNALVLTRHAGIPDIISAPMNGSFVEKQDPCGIAAALQYYLQNPKELKEVGLANAKEACEKYTEAAFINNLVNIIKD